MSIDIRTLILIIGITHLMQLLVFAHQYRVNRNVLGPGWWLMWSAAEFIGFALILLRGIPALNLFAIVLQNPIILTGTIFVYIGIMRFFERKVNLKILLAIIISYIFLHLFFVFVINDITSRTLVFDIYLSYIAFLTAYSLYKYKNASLSTTANFNTILFVVQGLVFTYRAIMVATGTDVTDVYSTSVFNLIQYFDALLIGLLWTFGFIIMLNQKLNTEISEAKTHFEQIFNTSPDAVGITRLNDGLLVDCNDSYSRILGYSKEDIIGNTTFEIGIWYNIDDRTEVVKEILKKGYLENREFLFIHRSGDLITGLVSGKIIQLKGVPHIISVTRDISERKKMEEALRESKEKFQQLADLLPQIVFESDINGRLTYVNKQAYKLFGYSEEENMIGFNTLDFYPPDDRARAKENITKSVSGQKSTGNNEYTMIRKDGSTFKGLVYSNPIIKDYKPAGLRGIIVDITKNKQAEEALRETNAYLENLINYANAPIIVWDPQFRITRFNHAFEHLTGRLESEVLGESLEILFPPELSDNSMALIRKTLTGERWETVEIEILHKTGAINTLLWNSATLFTSDGITPIATIAQGHDITIRKKAAEELTQTSTRLALATRAGGVGVWDWDIAHNTMHWDEQMFALYGIEKKDNAAYETWEKGLHPDDKEQAQNESQMALAGKKEYNTEFRVIWSDGSIHNIRALGIVQHDEKGTPLRMIGTNWDITEQKKNEEAIIIQNEELHKLNAEKDKFFSIISHDLKSPFNSIVGFSDLLVEQAREKNFDGIEQFADIILQSSHRAMGLLTNLMEWSRSQTGRMNYNPEYFEMVNLINEVMLLVNHTAAQKSISITKTTPRNAPVYADKDMISTVLRNLISNAIKFTPSGGNILIKIAQNPKELLVSISDTGVGIPKRAQEELFKIDTNISTLGTNDEKGTGLGLVLCKDFVEQNGGKLWAESEEGKGSTFYFTIPISIRE